MKKLLILILSITLLLLLLSSCEAINNVYDAVLDAFTTDSTEEHDEHTFEYVDLGACHFKQFTCGCPSPEIAEMHYDFDEDEICDACGRTHEHIFGEWQYSEDMHWCSWECTFEACDIDTADYHSDDDSNGVCDVCGYAGSDLHIHKEVKRFNENGHWWAFTCGCDYQVTVDDHFDTDGDCYCDVCSYYIPEIVQLGTVETWLNDITAEDVVSVRTTRSGSYTELLPGFVEIFTVTDKDDLADIIEAYRTYEMKTLDPMVCYDITDNQFTVSFNFVTGETKTIVAQGGFMYKGYDISDAPGISSYESAVLSYSFVRYYPGTGEVWVDDGENEPYCLCNIDLGRLEFIPFEGSVGTGVSTYPYYVEAPVGRLGFISPDLFFVVGKGECYQLIGDDLDAIIENALSPDYSLVMNDEEWLYEPLKATYKAGETVTVRIGMAYDLGYLFLVNGEDIADCRDVDSCYWEFTFTMPACNTVIDFKTYDGFLPDWNYSVLIRQFYLNYPDVEFVYVGSYYGEYDSGALVAVIVAGEYPAVILEETVGGFDFIYSSPGYRIRMLHDGEFIALPEAYAEGLLTLEDIESINAMHRENYPALYE